MKPKFLYYLILTVCLVTCITLYGSVKKDVGKEKIPEAGPPKKVKKGIMFQFYAPEADTVYLAGSFNNWADNDNGIVTDSSYAMSDTDGDGIWTKVIKLSPGRYTFKYVENGKDWHFDPLITEKDQDENSILYINKKGKVLYSGKNVMLTPKKTRKGILFRFMSPEAHIVYLAGTFNNWANNENGLVTDSSFAMSDEDGDGIWTLVLPLDPGQYSFKYVIDGDQWKSDPSIDKVDKDGNSILIVK